METTDPKIKLIRDKLREGLIKRIPYLLECLDKLPPDEYVKYYFMLTDIVEARNNNLEKNKNLQR